MKRKVKVRESVLGTVGSGLHILVIVGSGQCGPGSRGGQSCSVRSAGGWGDRRCRTGCGGWRAPAVLQSSEPYKGQLPADYYSGAGPFGMPLCFWLPLPRSGCGPPRWPRPDGAPQVDKATLLAESDVLSLHCPLSDLTRGIIDKDALHLIPSSSWKGRSKLEKRSWAL